MQQKAQVTIPRETQNMTKSRNYELKM